MQPWLNEKMDRLRRRNFFIPGCFCCGSGITTVNCGACTESDNEMSECWGLTVSGFTGNPTIGGDCSEMNGDFTLTKDFGSACSFSDVQPANDDTPSCGANGRAGWILRAGFPAGLSDCQWILEYKRGLQIHYQYNIASEDFYDFELQSSNEMTFHAEVTSFDCCDTWPGSLIVTPANCP